MSPDTFFILLLLIKHAFIDIGLQRVLGPTNKHIYTSKRAHWHYGHHGVGTMLVAFMFLGPLTALIAGAIDWIVHWHIDHTKAKINEKFNLNSSHATYWWLVSLDQALHYVTYVALVMLL